MEQQPGYEGAQTFTTDVHLSLHRREKRSVRAKPGTFEWRYAREISRKGGDGALYHAGVHFAALWERAGTASARSVDWSAAGDTSGWKGLPDGRAVAMQEVQDAEREIGTASSARLRAYCVRGETTGEIANAFDVAEREMAAVLKMDLHAAALHFRYL